MSAKIKQVAVAVLTAVGVTAAGGVAAQGRSIPLERPVVSAEAASERFKPVRLLHLYGSYAVTHGIPEYSTLYKDDTRDLVDYIAASCISPKTVMAYREKSQQELRVMHSEIARVFKP